MRGLLTRILILWTLILAAAAAQAAPPDPNENFAAPARVFTKSWVEAADSSAVLHWETDPRVALDRGVRGVRVYRLRPGTEMGFNVRPLEKLEDCGTKPSCKVDGLSNGDMHMFVARAYGADGKEMDQAMFFAFPGRPAGGKLRPVTHAYLAAGPEALAVFWDGTEDLEVVGYEVWRKSEGEADYRAVGRVPRVVRPDGVPGPNVNPETYLPRQFPPLFRDAEVAQGVTYSYKVRAFDAKGQFSEFAEAGSARTVPAASPRPEEVLLLVNSRVPESGEVARSYARLRGVPRENIVSIDFPKNLYTFNYEKHLAGPLRTYLLEHGLAGRIKVLVPCYGVPLGNGRRAVDSLLADLFGRYIWGRTMGTNNPWYNQNAHFDGTLGTYLVTRLDGPDPRMALGLAEKALQAEKSVNARSGAAYFTKGQSSPAPSEAAAKLGVNVRQEAQDYTKTNPVPDETMWCFAWGHPYRQIRRGPWPVGSVAAVLKSDSLVSIDARSGYWVPGLLKEGVTASFGSVVEPYVQGFTRGNVFFERFWTGEYSFAEAFNMATPTIEWAMCAVGDPLFRLRRP